MQQKDAYKVILAIESTCDETSACIFCGNLIAHTIYTSYPYQASYGGVVPELAARYHLAFIHEAVEKTLKMANMNYQDLEAIVYSAEPGLPGSVMVGKVFSHQLGDVLKVPVIGLNHLYGHLFSGWIGQTPTYPFLGLVVSGGETCIYLVNSPVDIVRLNDTADDAVGEVFDKVARKLGYPYPGGPKIDGFFDEAKANIHFINSDAAFNRFSFSGLKTAVINYIYQKQIHHEPIDAIAIGSSFQKFAIGEIIKKLKYYLNQYVIHVVSVGGGVAANSYLKQELAKLDAQVHLVERKYSGDNAAMIAYYGNLVLAYRDQNSNER